MTLDDDDIDITFDDIEDDENDSVAAEEFFGDFPETFNNESSSVEISVTEVATSEGIQNTPDGAERTVKPLPASESVATQPETQLEPTKKERLSFFQWLKNKNVFPDALLQMYMDSYEEEQATLDALWNNSSIVDDRLAEELGMWLSATTYDALQVDNVIPDKNVLSHLPAALFLEYGCLPINKVGHTLECLVANPFNLEREQMLKKVNNVERIGYQITTPRLVAEQTMRILQQYGGGGYSRHGVVSKYQYFFLMRIITFPPNLLKKSRPKVGFWNGQVTLKL